MEEIPSASSQEDVIQADITMGRRVWDVRSGKAASTSKLKKSAFLFLAWNPGDPNIIAAVQQDSETYFVDIQKQKVIKTLPSKLQACPDWMYSWVDTMYLH